MIEIQIQMYGKILQNRKIKNDGTKSNDKNSKKNSNYLQQKLVCKKNIIFEV